MRSELIVVGSPVLGSAAGSARSPSAREANAERAPHGDTRAISAPARAGAVDDARLGRFRAGFGKERILTAF